MEGSDVDGGEGEDVGDKEESGLGQGIYVEHVRGMWTGVQGVDEEL